MAKSKNRRRVAIIPTPEDDVPFKPAISGDRVKSRTFRLLNLGRSTSLELIRRKANRRGFELAESRWRRQFRKKFRIPTRPIDVVFGGSEKIAPFFDSAMECYGILCNTDGRWKWDWYSSWYDGRARWLASRKKPRR